MVNFDNDQAAGLRRIMAEARPRVISVLNADVRQHQPRLLNNLAASLVEQGHEVLMAHASPHADTAFRNYGITQAYSLVDAIEGEVSIGETINMTSLGFSVIKLMDSALATIPFDHQSSVEMDHTFNHLSQQYDVVLVSTVINKNHVLPIETLNHGEIVIQLNAEPESIKQGYTLIKQICRQLGRRSFGIVVDGVTDAQAAIIFRNISLVAKRYLQIELEFFGSIPADKYIAQAEKVGRSVLDAFPTSQASSAFYALAQRLNFQAALSDDFSNASLI